MYTFIILYFGTAEVQIWLLLVWAKLCHFWKLHEKKKILFFFFCLFLCLGVPWNPWKKKWLFPLSFKPVMVVNSVHEASSTALRLLWLIGIWIISRTRATLTCSCCMTAYTQALSWWHGHLWNQVGKPLFCLPQQPCSWSIHSGISSISILRTEMYLTELRLVCLC